MAGVMIYGDASGHQQQTTGATDYDMIRDHFAAHSSIEGGVPGPKSNPSVRERINLMNRQLKTAAGKIGLVVDPQCKELIKDLEQVCFKEGTKQIDKDRDRMRTHLSDALGYLLWQVMPRGGEDRAQRNLPIVELLTGGEHGKHQPGTSGVRRAQGDVEASTRTCMRAASRCG